MRIAGYCRKSTEDDRIDDNKSVNRQRNRCKEFAASKGWLLHDEDIYVDDGFSGADFMGREGLIRLQINIKQYDVLITADLDRLGRDTQRTVILLDDIINMHGVQVWYYQTGQQELADSPEQLFFISLRSFGADKERINASVRSRDTLTRKAQLGHVTGGCVYGYKNVPIYNQDAHGNQVRSHTKHEILESEAAVIRAIFTMYADGLGQGDIARVLNGESDERHTALRLKYLAGTIPLSPSAGRRGTGSWSRSCIHPMLRRERYIGIVTYGKHKKTRQSGRKNKPVKQETYKRHEFPELRIVEQALWDQVQQRLQSHRDNYNRHAKQADTTNKESLTAPATNLLSLPGLFNPSLPIDTGKTSKYLLTGMVRCGVCGGNIVVLGGKLSSKPGVDQRSYMYYGCSTHRNRGMCACPVNHRINMLELDTLVLDLVKRKLLSPQTREQIIRQTRELVSKQAGASETEQRIKQIKTESANVERSLKNLLDYIMAGNAPRTVLEEIRRLELRSDELKACLKSEETLQRQRSQFDAEGLEKWLSQLQPKLEELLSVNIEEARKVLRSLLAEPITIRPFLSGDGQVSSFLGASYVVTGTTTFGTTFSMTNKKKDSLELGEENDHQSGTKKSGRNKTFEYEITGKSTLGALVDSASYINMASPRGFEPRLSP